MPWIPDERVVAYSSALLGDATGAIDQGALSYLALILQLSEQGLLRVAMSLVRYPCLLGPSLLRILLPPIVGIAMAVSKSYRHWRLRRICLNGPHLYYGVTKRDWTLSSYELLQNDIGYYTLGNQHGRYALEAKSPKIPCSNTPFLGTGGQVHPEIKTRSSSQRQKYL